MIDQLIARTFQDRDLAHLEHWNTENGFAHEALGEFYESSVKAIDPLIEAYMGNCGKLPKVELIRPKGEVLKSLKETVTWADAHRGDICEGVSTLENLLDNLIEVYLKAIYKLTRFG